MKGTIVNIAAKVFVLVGLLSIWGCVGEDDTGGDHRVMEEKTIAVVLPMEKGLDVHWKRSLEMFSANLERAFSGKDTVIRLNFEYYDEVSTDLHQLARELAAREDIYAAIGGLYSSDAAILASELTGTGKTFFTLATSEELVRGYASTGYLWAMTETDITQCEVLLSKVINYRGKSVALIARANDDDIYGKTFIDWFGFQAKELGLENKGIFGYDGASLDETVKRAMQSGADYLICAPSDIEDIRPILDTYALLSGRGEKCPRLLFSATAFGIGVLTLNGDKIEGIEGVAFGAAPESGFDVTYRTFYGESPTTGEAQLYDAAMLIAYAAWYRQLHPDATLTDALRTIVSGEGINVGSWMAEGIQLAIDALAAGETPDIKGASGNLKFDAKIFTNVLSTTYYSYEVYDGKYIILDYNTSDGGNRTDATLAGWNWKISQMQDFNDSGSMAYPELKGNWAILVAASKGWKNYRHQADVLAIYQQLKAAGYADDHIILITEDDLAANSENPEQGVVRVKPEGANVRENAVVDYRLSDLQPDDFGRILLGQKSERLPEVVQSTENDNVFVYWSGHGVPNGMCWNEEAYGMTGDALSATLKEMKDLKKYRKLMMMVEACYSGGVVKQSEGIPGILFVTAANEYETSKADVFSSALDIWMSNRFTSTFIEQITENKAVSLRDLYYRLFINTVGSHVTVYNAANYGNLYQSNISEFIQYNNQL